MNKSEKIIDKIHFYEARKKIMQELIKENNSKTRKELLLHIVEPTDARNFKEVENLKEEIEFLWDIIIKIRTKY